MKVTRRITTDYLNQTVFAESVYNKTDPVAQLGNHIRVEQLATTRSERWLFGQRSVGHRLKWRYAPMAASRPSRERARQAGNYIVPNGVTITGILENEINTKVSQNNDRFRMTVQSPDEFRGATIEGYISDVNRSGKVTGQSNLTLNFEKITLRNGQTYDFAGNLQSITDASGKNIQVDNEGTIKGDNQTKQTVKRGGIGAGIGAVIGAIAGGGKGAAIGAIIGAGGGAGSVAVQGQSDIQLRLGSTITVQSSSPMNAGPR